MKTVESLILGLFALVVSAILTIENAVRGLLAGLGLSAQVQSVVLLFLAITLTIAAFRVLGPVFGILLAIFALLLVMQVAVPGMLTSLHQSFG